MEVDKHARTIETTYSTYSTTTATNNDALTSTIYARTKKHFVLHSFQVNYLHLNFHRTSTHLHQPTLGRVARAKNYESFIVVRARCFCFFVHSIAITISRATFILFSFSSAFFFATHIKHSLK